MKKLTLMMLLMLMLAPSATAKKSKYNHAATMTHHGAKVTSLIEGRKDLYYSGDYICTPGSDQYAPDCRLQSDWFVVDAVSYDDVLLEDGSQIIISPEPECQSLPTCRTRQPWDHDKVKYVLFGAVGDPIWRISVAWGVPKDDEQLTILYRVKKDGELDVSPLSLELANARRALQ
jgi:hypothetical protein